MKPVDMSELTFERLRIPAALVLVLIAAFIFVPRDGGSPASASATPRPSIVVGEPGGAVIASATAVPSTPIPTVTAAPTPSSSPTPTAVVADAFAAEVFACRSISGSECNDQLGTLPRRAGSFTALVRFTDANAGDAINVVLDGPSGTITGGPYTLGGGGNGYYYSTFSAGGLPDGAYTLTAFRNGAAVAETSFRKGR